MDYLYQNRLLLFETEQIERSNDTKIITFLFSFTSFFPSIFSSSKCKMLLKKGEIEREKKIDVNIE